MYLKISEMFLQVFNFFMHLNIDVMNILIFYLVIRIFFHN
jgi:hypothetical protein